ncbi:MAG: VanZ family protein [Chthoniobacterales bacterium]|nr:VanZ family protein [Chthoniobacterales bacterium]
MHITLRTFFRYWAPAIGWVLVILIASSDLMSAEHTSRFIGPFLRWIVPDISEAAIAAVQLCVRKAAHLAEYAILAALILRGFAGEATRPRTRHVLSAFALTAICASGDEFRQSFVASRTGSPLDVLLDVIGASVGLALYYYLRRRSAVAVPA